MTEDGSSKFLRNVGILPQHYTASQPTRHRYEFSSPYKPQVSPPVDSLIFDTDCLVLCGPLFLDIFTNKYREDLLTPTSVKILDLAATIILYV
jgi:hypothetical protein